jgi:hypothetical protein
MTNLVISEQGQPFQGANAIFAQVGWVGHRDGAVYRLIGDNAIRSEPGGVSPLYIQVGTYVNNTWED